MGGKYCCLPCQYGRAMQLALDKNCFLCCFFGTEYCRCCNRRMVRDKYGIAGTDCNDCLMCTFCALCSMMQVMHEVEHQTGKTMKCCGDIDEAAVTTTTTTTTTTSDF